MNTIFFSGLILMFIFYFLFYFLFDKEYKISYKDKYCKNPPFSYPPAILAFLFHMPQIPIKCLLASFLFLKGKNVLSIEPVNDINDIKTMKISLGDRASDYNMTVHEEHLIAWLMSESEDRKSITISGLIELLKDKDKAYAFYMNYMIWNRLVFSDAEQYRFFSSCTKIKIAGILISIIYCVLGVILFIYWQKIRFILFIALGILFFLFVRKIKRYTREGQQQYEKWVAFKRFCKDNENVFKGFEEVINEQFEILVSYAVTLGVLNELKYREKIEDEKWRFLLDEMELLEKEMNKIVLMYNK